MQRRRIVLLAKYRTSKQVTANIFPATSFSVHNQIKNPALVRWENIILQWFHYFPAGKRSRRALWWCQIWWLWKSNETIWKLEQFCGLSSTFVKCVWPSPFWRRRQFFSRWKSRIFPNWFNIHFDGMQTLGACAGVVWIPRTHHRSQCCTLFPERGHINQSQTCFCASCGVVERPNIPL